MVSEAAAGAAEASAGTPEVDEEARHRALLERLAGAPASKSPAPADVRSRLRKKPEEPEARGFALGWKMSLLIDVAMVIAPIPLVLAAPPYIECRERDRTFGFFVGDSVRACTARGIDERWRKLDSRLKMIVRDSGR